MTGFVCNGIAAAINFAIWATWGGQIPLICAVFSAAMAVGFLLKEMSA